MGAPSVRVLELARRWARRGHDVTVLTAFPNHPAGRVFPGYRGRFWRLTASERIDGVRVIRTSHVPRPNRGTADRLLAFSTFAASASMRSAFLRPFDVVIGTSPQILAPAAAWWRTRLPRRAFVLEVRDLWPESVVAAGLGQTGSAGVRALGAFARLMYRSADRVVAVTQSIKDRIVEGYGVPVGRVDVVPAAVDLEMFRPGPPPVGARAGLGVNGKFVAAYVGTMGSAHGLEIVIEAAQQLRDKAAGFTFLLVGDGAERARLQGLVARSPGLDVRLLPTRPIEAIPDTLAASDACLVLLKDDPLFRTVVPTKMLEYMAAGKPVVCNVEGEASNLLDRAGGGICVRPGDPVALAAALARLQSDPGLCARLGASGRRYVEQHSGWDARAVGYEEVLSRVLSDVRKGRGR